MKTLISVLTIAILCIGAFSCKKDKTTAHIQGNYVVAGRAGGFTAPNNKDKFFLINNGQLWLDYSHTDGTIPATVDGFSFTIQQSQADYSKAASLLTDIPQDLLATPDGTLGDIFPDAGYTEVWISANGAKHHWIFQADIHTLSPDIQLYVQRINSDLPW